MKWICTHDNGRVLHFATYDGWRLDVVDAPEATDEPPRAKTLVKLVASLQLDENGFHPGDIRDIVRYARRMQELGLPDNAGGQTLHPNVGARETASSVPPAPDESNTLVGQIVETLRSPNPNTARSVRFIAADRIEADQRRILDAWHYGNEWQREATQLKRRIAELEQERDEHYVRAASLLFSEKGSVLFASEVQRWRNDYIDWQERAEKAERELRLRTDLP